MSLTRRAALALALACPQAAAAGTALVYDGPGLCDGCAEATADWLEADGLPPAPLPGPALKAAALHQRIGGQGHMALKGARASEPAGVACKRRAH